MQYVDVIKTPVSSLMSVVISIVAKMFQQELHIQLIW